MSIYTFSMPDKGAKVTQEENEVNIKFGGNYEQDVTMGINPTKRVLNLTWKRPEHIVRPLFEWLMEMKVGKKPFQFTMYNDIERWYTCTECSYTDNSPSTCNLTATFKETHKL